MLLAVLLVAVHGQGSDNSDLPFPDLRGDRPDIYRFLRDAAIIREFSLFYGQPIKVTIFDYYSRGQYRPETDFSGPFDVFGYTQHVELFLLAGEKTVFDRSLDADTETFSRVEVRDGSKQMSRCVPGKEMDRLLVDSVEAMIQQLPKEAKQRASVALLALPSIKEVRQDVLSSAQRDVVHALMQHVYAEEAYADIAMTCPLPSVAKDALDRVSDDTQLVRIIDQAPRDSEARGLAWRKRHYLLAYLIGPMIFVSVILFLALPLVILGYRERRKHKRTAAQAT
jgi:hypothetical protein